MASKQTLVTVRVIAKDGKFLGDDIGGSLVTIRNVETGVMLEPPTHLSLSSLPANVTISANVMMMCGCPISPGGVWNSEHFEIAAQIRKEGKIIDTVKLVYAGSPSQFTGSWTVKRKGYYEAIVYAFQPATG